MKLWLSKNSEIPVREQLVTQIALGIASSDLKTGEKLPSTREMSRRFKIHANTVSSAYQKLVEQNLIELRKGSGFFVSENKTSGLDGESKLNQLTAEYFQSAQKLGFSFGEIEKRLRKWLVIQPPKRFLVIESDESLREILVEEIKQATDFPVEDLSIEEFSENPLCPNAILIAMIDKKAKIQTILPPNKICIFLKSRSVSDSMTGETRPSANDLIAVVSNWEKFLAWSKMFLTAANVESDLIILRSTKEKDWRNGLKSAAMIICDSLTAKSFPHDKRVRVFRVIADDSINDLPEILNSN